MALRHGLAIDKYLVHSRVISAMPSVHLTAHQMEGRISKMFWSMPASQSWQLWLALLWWPLKSYNRTSPATLLWWHKRCKIDTTKWELLITSSSCWCWMVRVGASQFAVWCWAGKRGSMKVWEFCQSVATMEEMALINRALFARHDAITNNFSAARTVGVLKSL